MRSPSDFDGPLTEKERETVAGATQEIERVCGNSRSTLTLSFDDERPIVQDTVFAEATAAGWNV